MNFLSSILACSTCQNTMKLGGGDAVGWSILFLLAVILAVASMVVFFMARIIIRARKYAAEEQAELS